MTLTDLRQKHPRFIYNSYEVSLTKAGLKITHHFKVEPNIEFHPTVTIEGVTPEQWEAIPPELRDKWIFHLGLAEIPSYWKAAASPEIVIKAGYLNPDQVSWWHNLLIEGMGEYFYINKIDFMTPDFVKWIIAAPATELSPDLSYPPVTSDYLIPIGGGKDSTLTTCFFDQKQPTYDVFLLNPTPAMNQIAQTASPQQTIIARRIIDPKLLELNEEGYLNGHTPFSAYLGFLSRFTGFIFGHQSIVISNERSSNEGNVLFHGKTINHQYSKTYDFELGFNEYLKKNGLISPQQTAPAYFSFLRPLYELQISQIFLSCPLFDQYSAVFRSCNRGQKTNTWCGECPKCLFAFITFYPFLPEKKVVDIFGQNLFDKKSLLDEALALLGKTEVKPFDCVGTRDESIAAFYLCVEKARTIHDELPILLQLVWEQVLSKQHSLKQRSDNILHSWDQNHQLPADLEEMIHDAIKNIK